jgi:hypothetical protein
MIKMVPDTHPLGASELTGRSSRGARENRRAVHWRCRDRRRRHRAH